MDKNFNPEELHDIAQSTSKVVSDKFVNPGTPESAMVKRTDMAQATLSGGTEQLRKKLTK